MTLGQCRMWTLSRLRRACALCVDVLSCRCLVVSSCRRHPLWVRRRLESTSAPLFGGTCRARVHRRRRLAQAWRGRRQARWSPWLWPRRGIASFQGLVMSERHGLQLLGCWAREAYSVTRGLIIGAAQGGCRRPAACSRQSAVRSGLWAIGAGFVLTWAATKAKQEMSRGARGGPNQRRHEPIRGLSSLGCLSS